MKVSKKLSALTLVGVMAATMLVGCGGGNQEKKEEAKANDDYQIKLGYYNCDHMTAAPVAEAAGIYKDNGLNVTTVGNGKVPEAMAAGQMDAGYIGTRGLVAASVKGSPIVVAANNHSGGSEYLVASNDINDPKELLGQKIAADPENDFLFKVSYGPETGLPAENDKYQIVNIDSDKDKYLALKTGQIKAFTTCDPWGSMAEYEKVGKLIGTSHYHEKARGKEYNCCSFSLNKNFIKDHPELAEKLVKAHTQAIEYIYTNPVKSAKIFAKAYSVPEDVALMTIYKKTCGEGRTLTWKIGDAYKNNLEIYKEVKAVEQIPKYEDVVNEDILKKSGADDFDTFIKEKVDKVFPLGMSFDDWKAKAQEVDEKL